MFKIKPVFVLNQQVKASSVAIADNRRDTCIRVARYIYRLRATIR